ncbi:MAG TPA: GNAT family N-acetyltransferase [Candidatus Limnocylindrales bacterium]
MSLPPTTSIPGDPQPSPAEATADASDDEPACPLVARQIAFEAIPRGAWDRLLAATSVATAFSRWSVHRAWWDAYGSTAHQQYLVCVDADAPAGAELDAAAVRGIAPLMHRHEVEPEDAETATHMRHGHPTARAVRPTAKAIFFGASYHADYATILAEPSDLEAVAELVVDALLSGPDLAHGDTDWDVVDLRRLRHDDPALPALQRAFERRSVRGGWHVSRELEDVCPVLTLPDDGDWEAYLSTLDKKDRHEIRRKIRRAEAAGPNTFRLVEPTPQAVESFIDLHQSKWGDEGLFPATAGGDRSRRFIHRLAELELETGADRQLQLGDFEIDGQVVMTAVGFDDGRECLFYNAGVSRDARDLSPGVTGIAAYLRDRMDAGRRRFDFLRGDEPYKYEWGAVDEPIYRLLVERFV